MFRQFCFRKRTETPKFRLLYDSDQRSLSYVENNLTALGARADRVHIYVERPFDREFQIEGEDPEAVKKLFSGIDRSEIKTLPQKMIVEATEAATFFYYPRKLVPVNNLRKTYEICKDLHRSLMRRGLASLRTSLRCCSNGECLNKRLAMVSTESLFTSLGSGHV